MSDKTCGGCRHWGPVRAIADEFDVIDMDERVYGNLRPCLAIKMGLEGIGPEPGAKAEVLDGSGYYATLRTAEDFGCVLWQGIAAEAAGGGE